MILVLNVCFEKVKLEQMTFTVYFIYEGLSKHVKALGSVRPVIKRCNKSALKRLYQKYKGAIVCTAWTIM